MATMTAAGGDERIGFRLPWLPTWPLDDEDAPARWSRRVTRLRRPVRSRSFGGPEKLDQLDRHGSA